MRLARVLGGDGFRLPVLRYESGQVLTRITRQPLHVGKQDATMPLGQSELSEPLEYSGYEHATLGFIGLAHLVYGAPVSDTSMNVADSIFRHPNSRQDTGVNDG